MSIWYKIFQYCQKKYNIEEQIIDKLEISKQWKKWERERKNKNDKKLALV